MKHKIFTEAKRRRRCCGSEERTSAEEGKARETDRRREGVAQGKETDQETGKLEVYLSSLLVVDTYILKQDRDEPQPAAEKRRKDDDKPIKISHHNGEVDERQRRHVRMNDDVS